MDIHSKSVPSISEGDTRAAAVPFSVDELRQELLETPRNEVIDRAYAFQHDYRNLLERGERQLGRISSSFFSEVLEDAYPEIDGTERRSLAWEMEKIVLDKFGVPSRGITKEEVAEADAKARAAQEILAGSLTPDEVESLELTARKRIPSDRWPDNFDDFKEQWLAGWIAKGILALPE